MSEITEITSWLRSEAEYDAEGELLYGEREIKAATLIEEQAARIAELQAELEREKKETERLDGAWNALHERMVKDNEGHARYFEKSQARIHELFDAEAASQARLSEAVKVLESVMPYACDLSYDTTGSYHADLRAAKGFIATLGENKNEA